jgi:cytochrome c peroxidase
MRYKISLAIAFAAVGILVLIATASAQAALTQEEELGKFLFFDTNLSEPAGQSCAACHGPEVGYTGPSQAISAGGAVYEGAVSGRFGNRKPPAAARSCIGMGKTGWAACSGMAGLPVGLWEIRWRNKPRGLS